MTQAPSTVVQLILLVLVVLPGVTYQFVRERWRGLASGHEDLGHRVLRAVTASLILDAVYVIVAGPWLVRLVAGPAGAWDGFARHTRLLGLAAMLLLVLIPAVAAVAVSVVKQRRLRASFHPAPTAWDFAFQDRGPCFVRARLADGSWVGGWYGSRSYANSYPRTGELYLESAWNLDPDGGFKNRVELTAGLYIRVQEADALEFLDMPTTPGGTTASEEPHG